MTIVVAEKWDSRETTLGEDSSVDLRYVVGGTDSDIDAHVALLANSPTLYGGLVRQSSHLVRVAEDAWEGTVRYGKVDPPETGDSSFSFDTGGGNQHITQGLGTVGAYAAPGQTAPTSGVRSVSPRTVSKASTSRSRSTTFRKRITSPSKRSLANTKPHCSP